MSDDVKLSGVWGLVVIVVISTLSISFLKGCEASERRMSAIGEACVASGGSWVRISNSFNCLNMKTGEVK